MSRRAARPTLSRRSHMPPVVVQLRELPSIPLAVIRRQARPAELSRVVPECCGLVWKAVQAQHAQGGRHVALYWDATIRLEVGVEMLGPFAEQGDVIRSATPAGAVGTGVHPGPYGGPGGAHDAIREWCRANRHRLTGVRWEIYGHWQKHWDADPSQIQTDVFYQIAAG